MIIHVNSVIAVMSASIGWGRSWNDGLLGLRRRRPWSLLLLLFDDADESSSFGENDDESSSSLHVRVMRGILLRLAVITVVMIFLFRIIIVRYQQLYWLLVVNNYGGFIVVSLLNLVSYSSPAGDRSQCGQRPTCDGPTHKKNAECPKQTRHERHDV
jgi:hypothetical protein